MASDGELAGVRIAVVYDCLFPYTVGGGERWYRRMAEEFRDAGADVTYLTRRQWDAEPPDLPGIRVVAVSGRSDLYDDDGRRLLLPTVRFGVGLLGWLVRHRRDFDVVQLASFPFWSIPAVRGALVGTDVRVVVDWFEIWSRDYWRSYAGRLTGALGYQVQRLCLRLSPEIIVLSRSNASRLRTTGHRRDPIVLAGFLPTDAIAARPPEAAPDAEAPYVLFAGRHIRDKGVDLLAAAFAAVRRREPSVRYVIVGDGPLRRRVIEECAQRGLSDVVEVPGWVTDEELEHLIAGAACVVAPSRREGYGFMPVDAIGKGTPVVTTGFAENLAVDNIDPGRNGFVASPPTPECIAEGILAVLAGGAALRRTTSEWYSEHAPTKTVDRSVHQMVSSHAEWARRRRTVGGRRPRRRRG